MPRACSHCGEPIPIRSFRFWDGRCNRCGTALTIDKQIEDARCPLPTRDDIIEYLKYMDDLNAMRFAAQTVKYLGIQAMAIWGLVILGNTINLIPTESVVVAWAAIGISTLVIAARLSNRKCPRCKQRFNRSQKMLSRLKFASSDACKNCGLKLLTQSDLRRAGFVPDADDCNNEAT